MLSRFSRLQMVLATLSDTSLEKTYRTANTKKAIDASRPLPCRDSLMRATRDLLLRNAYSVSLDASDSPEGLLKMALIAGMKEALDEQTTKHGSDVTIVDACGSKTVGIDQRAQQGQAITKQREENRLATLPEEPGRRIKAKRLTRYCRLSIFASGETRRS